MGLIEAIGEGPIGLDTAILIYLIEEHERYLPAVEPVFAAIDAGDLEAVTSGLTLLEVLVVPYRAGNARLAERYENLLTRSRGVRMLDIDCDVLRAAAQLRAAAGVKTPDAIQVAAALVAECPVFLTNDRALPAIPGLKVLQLSDFV